MSAFRVKEYTERLFESKTKAELIDLALNNQLSQKNLRDEAIKEDFYKLLKSKRCMDAYYELEVKYRISQAHIMLILKQR